jgi:mannitol-1-phosphate/altronate dehydrogenase
MGVSWLGALCLIESGVIIWMSGFLCSSIRFHRKQQVDINHLSESVAYWMDYSRQMEEKNTELQVESIELKEVAENQRHENESAKRALEFFDEMRRALEKHDDGPMPF